MARITFDRDFYLPKSETLIKAEHADANAVVYTYESNGRPYAILFVGKAAKPLWHYSFKTETRRADYIEEALNGQRARVKAKADRAAARKAFKHTLTVGTVLKSSWGYEQTNIDFYEVTEVKGKHVVVRELAQMRQETGNMTGTCAPVPGHYVGEPSKHLVLQGNCIKFASYQYAFVHEATEVTPGVKVYAPSNWTAYA